MDLRNVLGRRRRITMEAHGGVNAMVDRFWWGEEGNAYENNCNTGS